MEISPESGSNLTPGTNLVPTSGSNLSHCENWSGTNGTNLSARPYAQEVTNHTISCMENRLVPLVPLVPNKGFCGQNGTNPPVPTPLGGTNVGTQTPKFQPQGLRHIGDILPGVLKRLRKQATP